MYMLIGFVHTVNLNQIYNKLLVLKFALHVQQNPGTTPGNIAKRVSVNKLLQIQS